MSLKCADCYYLRIRLTRGIVSSYYCALTGEDVSAHDYVCQRYVRADCVWRREKAEGR